MADIAVRAVVNSGVSHIRLVRCRPHRHNAEIFCEEHVGGADELRARKMYAKHPESYLLPPTAEPPPCAEVREGDVRSLLEYRNFLHEPLLPFHKEARERHPFLNSP